MPPVDERSIEIDASAEAAWAALFPTLTRMLDGKLSRRLAQRLKARDTVADGDLHHPGGTLPGFVVARAISPVMLALMGEHRFSSYALVIRIDLLPGQRSRVRAETRASFPGVKGTLYKTAVVGSRGHAFTIRRMLRSLKKQAERRASGR